MLGHVLAQLPLLALAGVLLATSLPYAVRQRLNVANEQGIPGILLTVLAAAFWMLPRSLDAALTTPLMELVKFVSLPALIGLPMALSWPKLGPVTKAFVLGNTISMLGVLGWLYISAPTRLCNYYIVAEQVLLGEALLIIALALAVPWIVKAFVGRVQARPA